MGLKGRILAIYSLVVAAGLVMLFACSQHAQTPPVVSATPTPVPTAIPTPVNPFDSVKALTLNEAIDLALTQASNYKAAQINELSAGEDVKQARAAFLPKVTAPLNFFVQRANGQAGILLLAPGRAPALCL